MSRRRSALALLFALVLSMLATAFAGASSAGGPTSVLLVAPGSGRTASLYVNSPEYAELARLMGVEGEPSGEKVEPPGMGSDGAGVTITWLIHDAQVWRVDRVDLSPDDGPLITTQEDASGAGIWKAPATLHRSTEGTAIVALFNRLGLGVNGPSEPESAEPDTSSPAATSPAAAPPATAAGRARSSAYVWGAGGVLLGAALAIGALEVRRRVIAARAARVTEAADPLDDDLELLDSRLG